MARLSRRWARDTHALPRVRQHAVGYAGADGMEHLYSTQLIDPHPWSDTAAVLPAVAAAAHEYFHVWNVKRIRPAALGPFDYTREQYQPSLWVAEGWTQYYGEIGL